MSPASTINRPNKQVRYQAYAANKRAVVNQMKKLMRHLRTAKDKGAEAKLEELRAEHPTAYAVACAELSP